MKECKNCGRKFPRDCISKIMTIAISGEVKYMDVCAICALEITNKAHHQNRNNFAIGSIAQDMLKAARRHLVINKEGET